MASFESEPVPAELGFLDGYRAGLEAAATSLDPKTSGNSEKPPSGQPFHRWYSARQVRSLIPEPVSGVYPVSSSRPTLPEPAQTGPELVSNDYTVQALSDRVAYLERELASLEDNYQENLRIALAAAADHITRLASDLIDEEGQRAIVRPVKADELCDTLTVKVRGLALLFEEA